MRVFTATLSAAILILLFSCQKERDLANKANSGSDATSVRLAKTVSKSGTDSTVSIYSYNSSGKLIDITTTGSDQGDVIFTKETIIRNSKGVIQKIIFKDTDLIQSGIDSFLVNAHYDENLSRYTSRVGVIDYGSITIKDSVVFVYDANGKIVTESGYTDNGTGIYHTGGKGNYTYVGSTIATTKLFSYNAGAYEEDFTLTNEYDAKTSPLILGNEAFIVDYQGLAGYYSSNNVTKQTVTYPSDPAETYTITYTYNSFNLPATSVSRAEPGTVIFNTAYFYQ